MAAARNPELLQKARRVRLEAGTSCPWNACPSTARRTISRRWALRDALARLPEKDRAALHLFYGEGLTAREIGAITGEKEASVRSRLSRARAQLRKEWEGGA